MFRFVLIYLLISGCGFLSQFGLLPVRPATQDMLPMRDIVYGAKPDNTLDVYLPDDGHGPFPVVFLIHGTDVNKDYFNGTGTIVDLVNNGYAAVSINYPEPTPDDPARPLRDVACALAWVHASSDRYPFAPDSIVSLGHSRGAALAILTAMIDESDRLLTDCAYSLPESGWVQGAIGYGGSYVVPEASFENPNFIRALEIDAGYSTAEIHYLYDLLTSIPPSEWRTSPEMPEAIRQQVYFLPLAWLDGSVPPTLLVHGEYDDRTPLAESQAFAEALAAVDAPVTLVIIPAGYHRLDQSALREPLFAFLAEVTGATDG